MTQDESGTQDIVLKSSPATVQVIQALCRQLGLTPSQLIVKALSFIEMAMGRKVVLKEEGSAWEVNDFKDKPVRVKFNVKQ